MDFKIFFDAKENKSMFFKHFLASVGITFQKITLKIDSGNNKWTSTFNPRKHQAIIHKIT